VNLCIEQLECKYGEWIDRQHGSKIQVPTGLCKTTSIKALSSKQHVRTYIEGWVLYVNKQTLWVIVTDPFGVFLKPTLLGFRTDTATSKLLHRSHTTKRTKSRTTSLWKQTQNHWRHKRRSLPTKNPASTNKPTKRKKKTNIS